MIPNINTQFLFLLMIVEPFIFYCFIGQIIVLTEFLHVFHCCKIWFTFAILPAIYRCNGYVQHISKRILS